jgi:phosphate transport system protein
MSQDITSDPNWSTEGPCPNRHFFRDVEILWSELLKLAAIVEVSLASSVRVLCDGRVELAEQVREEEREIDRREVFIERDCLRLLALYQPVACDLRRVVSILKINAQLERMGDLSARIAKRSKKLVNRQALTGLALMPRIEDIAAESVRLVRDSLDALARTDVDLAWAVITGDRTINRHSRAILKEIKQGIRREPERVTTWLRLMNVARNLERIGDHATSIARDVIYMKQGDIVRHRGAEEVLIPDGL